MDWQRIDKVLLANTSLKPWELLELTLPETVFLLRSITEKNRTDSGADEDPIAIQAKINKAFADAALYNRLTLEQKLEMARREIDY